MALASTAPWLGAAALRSKAPPVLAVASGSPCRRPGGCTAGSVGASAVPSSASGQASDNEGYRSAAAAAPTRKMAGAGTRSRLLI